MSTQEQRERFEAAQRPKTDLAKNRRGDYTNPVVQHCWGTWRAAEAAAIERCAASVKALHALISDPSIVGDERSDGAHNALYAAEIAIRALLPKEGE